MEMQPVKGIGGTLAAAVLGANPWKSPLDAYNIIYGIAGEEEEHEAMTWGSRLEPLIAREYATQTGAILWPHTDIGLDYRYPLHHAAIDWWTGTPDRLVIADPKYLIDPDSPGEKVRAAIEDCLASPDFWAQVVKGWEAKTAGWRMLPLWGDASTDEVPDAYLIQVAWYLGLCRSYNARISEWDLSVLLGGQQFRTYRITHSPRLEEVLQSQISEFWLNHILARTPPRPSADPAWKDYFRRVYPRETEPLAEATPDEQDLFVALWEARQSLDTWQDRYETLSNELKLRLGDREGIRGSLGNQAWKLTWKLTKDREKTDWEAVVKDLSELPDMQKIVLDLVSRHTVIVPGVRRFLPSWPKSKKEKTA